MTAPDRPRFFVISLDFELHWGVHDCHPLSDYAPNLRGEREAVPAMLDLFARYQVAATWAVVGFLFFESKDELLAALPHRIPQYRNPKLSSYRVLREIGEDECGDPFHFAPSLIRRIASAPRQEIATHTFSHYYCLEEGQELADFAADLECAQRAAGKYNLQLRSIVFPRNQDSPDYLRVAAQAGLRAYRGNPPGWFYQRSTTANDGLPHRRLARLLDAYLPVSDSVQPSPAQAGSDLPVNVPATRFLRPYSRRLRMLESLRLRRIFSEFEQAAQRDCLYHLWWHPHNFGADSKENLAALERILLHYVRLREQYGVESLTMAEAAERALARPKSAALQVRA